MGISDARRKALKISEMLVGRAHAARKAAAAIFAAQNKEARELDKERWRAMIHCAPPRARMKHESM